MKRLFQIALILVATTLCAGVVPVITVDGAINPVSAEYIIKNLETAQDEGAPCFVIRLDTPGGLMSSTEDLTRAIMASDIPVVVYVWPKGGRAASAGVFITYASHIAAMTPGTRIGAAHPVSMMGASNDSSETMMEKVSNDAVANLRSIAVERGRNPDWPEAAIRESESITADKAVEIGAVEYLAEDLPKLLEKIDGAAYGEDKSDTLYLDNPVVDLRSMTQVQRFLFTILNPNIAYMLMMLGIVGIYLELQNPGTIFPGVVGGISILLALYAFQILPVNYVGIALIILAVALFIFEANTPTFGLLTTGGVVAMLAGSFLLTSGNPTLFSVSWKVILPTVALAAAVTVLVLLKVVRARVSKPVSGREGLVGEEGVVTRPAREGLRDIYVEIHGELWAARGEDLSPGDRVVVKEVQGRYLIVEKK